MRSRMEKLDMAEVLSAIYRDFHGDWTEVARIALESTMRAFNEIDAFNDALLERRAFRFQGVSHAML